MPYEDVSQRGKNYRIVWEEPNISHPECLKVIAVEILNPVYKIIFRTGRRETRSRIHDKCRPCRHQRTLVRDILR
jgi:hypothetical protein